MNHSINTKAQKIVKHRVEIFEELAAEYRGKAEPGKGDWKFELVMQADAIARELRDVLRVMEVAGA